MNVSEENPKGVDMVSASIIKNIVRVSVGAFLAIGLLFASTTPGAAVTPDEQGGTSSSVSFLRDINNARQHPELYPPHGNTTGAIMTACPAKLQYSSALYQTAAAHNDYLASRPISWVSTYPNMHRDPNGKLVWESGEPMDRAGYHSYRGEIVAWGFPTSEAALRAWMQDDAGSSWGHRNLILNCVLQDAGPAILQGGPGNHYHTVDMGSR
jgi:hypothetical protein